MTTATMATPAKTKIENVSLRTFLEKNGIGGRLGNGLVMDPTHLNIIPGFNTRTAGLGEAYWELPEVKDHLARLAQQGVRAVQLYCVNLSGVDAVRVAEEIDPAYAAECRRARDAGVEFLAYASHLDVQGVWLRESLPVSCA